MNSDKDNKSNIKTFCYFVVSLFLGITTISLGKEFIPMTINVVKNLLSPVDEFGQVLAVLLTPGAIVLTIMFVGIPFALTIFFFIMFIKNTKKK